MRSGDSVVASRGACMLSGQTRRSAKPPSRGSPAPRARSASHQWPASPMGRSADSLEASSHAARDCPAASSAPTAFCSSLKRSSGGSVLRRAASQRSLDNEKCPSPSAMVAPRTRSFCATSGSRSSFSSKTRSTARALAMKSLPARPSTLCRNCVELMALNTCSAVVTEAARRVSLTSSSLMASCVSPKSPRF